MHILVYAFLGQDTNYLWFYANLPTLTISGSIFWFEFACQAYLPISNCFSDQRINTRYDWDF